MTSRPLIKIGSLLLALCMLTESVTVFAFSHPLSPLRERVKEEGRKGIPLFTQEVVAEPPTQQSGPLAGIGARIATERAIAGVLGASGNSLVNSYPRLTRRQQEVVEGLAKGLSQTEIADELQIEKKTVEMHTRHILDELIRYLTISMTQRATIGSPENDNLLKKALNQPRIILNRWLYRAGLVQNPLVQDWYDKIVMIVGRLTLEQRKMFAAVILGSSSHKHLIDTVKKRDGGAMRKTTIGNHIGKIDKVLKVRIPAVALKFWLAADILASRWVRPESVPPNVEAIAVALAQQSEPINEKTMIDLVRRRLERHVGYIGSEVDNLILQILHKTTGLRDAHDAITEVLGISHTLYEVFIAGLLIFENNFDDADFALVALSAVEEYLLNLSLNSPEVSDPKLYTRLFIGKTKPEAVVILKKANELYLATAA